VSGFAMSCAVNMIILLILCDLCMLPAQFCYVIIYIQKVESRVQLVGLYAFVVASWNIHIHTLKFLLRNRAYFKFQTAVACGKHLRNFHGECSSVTLISSCFSSASTESLKFILFCPSAVVSVYIYLQLYEWVFLFGTVTLWNVCWNTLFK
jgi:hypothetical protein